MTAALISWWHGRNPREQWLLVVAVLLFIVVVGWLGILQPLMRARADAAKRLETATADLGEIRAQTAVIRTAQVRARSTSAVPAIEIVRQRVAETGLTVDAMADDGAGRVTLHIPAVKPAALLRWIARLETQDHMTVDQLMITRNGDATVAADLGVRGTGR